MGIKKLFSSKTSNRRRMNKTPFDFHGNQQEKLDFSRSTLSWILATVLLIICLLVTILFLYPPYDQMILACEEPTEVKMFPPRLENAVDIENHPVTTHEKIQKSKAMVNTLDFEFIINPTNLCATINHPNSVEYQRNPEVKMLILVQSAADHFEERIAIRNTWGSVAERTLGPLRLGFVLDNEYEIFTTDKTIDDLIHQESSEFRDILQINLLEGLQMLSDKSIFMLKWVATMCPHAEYFLKTEDNTFVNIRKIADVLNKGPYASDSRFIVGYIKRKEPSLKFPQMEFPLTEENYSLVDLPPYAISSYFMPILTAIDLFGVVSRRKDYFIEDDAYLTGVCAKRIGVPLIHEPSFIVENPPMPPSWDTYSALATAHSVTPDELEQVWEDLTNSIPNAIDYFQTAINEMGSFQRKKGA